MKILVTGAQGFVGKNLTSVLNARNGFEVLQYDRGNSLEDLGKLVQASDFVVHLAGVNRPDNADEFYSGNSDLTSQLCELLEKSNSKTPILLSSSIQAERDNDYGKSKLQAEERVLKYAADTSSKAYIFRFKNLYGKWSRPNYNSVVATWCYNIARDIEITVSDPSIELELCYIDDVIDAIMGMFDAVKPTGLYEVPATDKITLGELEPLINSFKESRTNFIYPDQSSRLAKNLYATYLSYLPKDMFSYPLKTNIDDRGSFSEYLKSDVNGQISISVSKPGVTKGQHWHQTKSEKFLVVRGKGMVRFRDVFSEEIIEYPVSGDELEVVDVPTGYRHSLVNLGKDDMITIIWANELFDRDRPDTNYEEV